MPARLADLTCPIGASAGQSWPELDCCCSSFTPSGPLEAPTTTSTGRLPLRTGQDQDNEAYLGQTRPNTREQTCECECQCECECECECEQKQTGASLAGHTSWGPVWTGYCMSAAEFQWRRPEVGSATTANEISVCLGWPAWPASSATQEELRARAKKGKYAPTLAQFSPTIPGTPTLAENSNLKLARHI